MTHSQLRRRVALVATAFVTAATVVLTGCAPSAPAEDAPLQAGGTLTYGRLAAANDLDLHTQITANNAFAIDNIFDTLVRFDEAGTIVDWLAEQHTVSADGRTYEFTLHDGIQFSDGTELTASDVKFSLERNLALEGPLMLTAPITGIAVDDSARTVEIALEEPYTPLLSELTSFSAGVIPADFGGKTEVEFFAKPIGTGAFAIDKWDPVGDLVFVKNEHYWQEGLPFIDKLVYSVADSDEELLDRLNTGKIDVSETVLASHAAGLEADGHVQLLSDESWAIEQLFFNTQKPEFSDVHVRRAIAHALDLERMVETATFGTSHAATSLIPPSIEYSAVDEGYALTYDLELARAELAKSKYPAGFKAKLLISSGNSVRAKMATAVQRSLAKIDISVEVETIDLPIFRERFKAFDYDFMINSGQSDAPDPNGLVTFQADPEGFSSSFWTHYTNDNVTRLMHEGRTEPEGPAREQIYFEIQKILAEDAPYIPLYYASNLHGAALGVKGLVTLPNGSIRFAEATISK